MNDSSGPLLLVPNLLGAVPPETVLPARTIALARTVEHWVVETPKAARAFLKTLSPPRPIAELSIVPLDADATPAGASALLAPARQGHPVGFVPDAGAPGIADPGAALDSAAHAAGIRVVPLVGPSAILLALMASGLAGQSFAFHGYLPVVPAARTARLRELEIDSRTHARTEIFIETPYRNAAMLAALAGTLSPRTRLAVAADLTTPGESVVMRPVSAWRGADFAAWQRRPAIFLFQA